MPSPSLPPLVEPGPPLSTGDAARFARHALLPGLGAVGQRRLRNARVLVIGAGGLGSPALLYLAAAGVGTLGVVDDDVVELSNLQRQVIHGVADSGRAKVDSAADAVHRLDPAVEVVRHPVRLDAENALEILGGYDLVVDGADNFATRYLVADATEMLGLPCVWGSILRFDGQVSVFWPGHGPLYRDVFPEPPAPGTVPSCAEAGVLGTLCASVGGVMGTEAVKVITGTGSPLVGRLLVHDALAATWREIRVIADADRRPATTLRGAGDVCVTVAPTPGSRPTVTARELAHLMAEPAAPGREVLVIDVREPEEHELAHIEGAVLIPRAQLLDGSVELPRDRPVVLHCQRGHRSAEVLDHLVGAGYADVRHLEGGIEAWLAR